MKYAVVLLIFAVITALSQDVQLGERGKRGVEMIRHKAYDKAARLIEEALEFESPKNPLLYENLGLAYLGCSGGLDATACIAKAEAAMNQAIELGGRAAFIVDRSLEKGVLFIKNPNLMKVKRGMLYVTKTSITFEPLEQTDTKDGARIIMQAANIKSVNLNKRSGKSTSFFHIESKDGDYDFRTENFSSDEAEMLFRLLDKHLGIKTRK